MRRFLVSVLALAAVALSSTARAGSVITTTDFESFALPASGFDNGSDGSGGFTIDGNFFNNAYDATWGSWAGWAISNHDDASDPTWLNQYSAITGTGAGGSSQYAVAFSDEFNGDAFINIADGQRVLSMDVTNTTYGYFTMRDGDANGFARPFGPDDYLLLTISGYSGFGGTGDLIGAIPVYLAGDGEILNSWLSVDLAALGDARSLSFGFESSDVGLFGINTPTYVAVDNFQTISPSAAVPEPAGLVLLGVGLMGAVGFARRARRASA